LPPESRRTCGAARTSIWSASIALAHAAASSRMLIGPSGGAVVARRGDVLAHRALRQERAQAVGRDEHDAGADRVVRVPRLQRLPRRGSRRARAALAGEHVEELVLPLPVERGDPEDLAGASANDTSVHAADARADDLERGASPSARRRRRRLAASAAASPRAARLRPSMYSTIASSPPSCGTIVATRRRRGGSSRGRRSRSPR
jgi:hypothetical protein